MKRLIIMSAALLATAAAQAQTTPGFTRTAKGLEYKIYNDQPGATAKVGDMIEIHIVNRVGDSLLFNSRAMNNNQPVQFQLQAPTFAGDVSEGFAMLGAGDSAVLLMSVDSLQKTGSQLMPFMKPGTGQKIVFEVKMMSVKSQAQVQQEQEANAKAQIAIDDKILQDYFKKNKIKPMKTASGLYYVITKQGTGDVAKAGQQVTVNYTGKFMDGKPFDSNTDSTFQHVQPFPVTVGQGGVIKGWDEGLQLLKKGSKATFYIPSTLAYGPNARGPIKANDILVFDIEVLEIK